MPWLQVKIPTDRAQAEHLEDALLTAGALAVTFQDYADQPILEPSLGETPLWDQTLLTGLFNADIDTTAISDNLTSQFAGLNLSLRWEQVEDKNWEREWMKNYQPIRCGEQLLICPSWYFSELSAEGAPDAGKIKLMLDPGLAFGTGTHPTTFLCLQWLDGLALDGLTVVDYGCGSGILAIAALLLGAKSALCVDIDPQALIATRENAARNSIDPARITTCFPNAVPTVKAEIVIANILAGPLVKLAPTLSELTAPGGRLCLSGILANQAPAVAEHYQQAFTLSPPALREEWAQLSAVKH